MDRISIVYRFHNIQRYSSHVRKCQAHTCRRGRGERRQVPLNALPKICSHAVFSSEVIEVSIVGPVGSSALTAGILFANVLQVSTRMLHASPVVCSTETNITTSSRITYELMQLHVPLMLELVKLTSVLRTRQAIPRAGYPAQHVQLVQIFGKTRTRT